MNLDCKTCLFCYPVPPTIADFIREFESKLESIYNVHARSILQRERYNYYFADLRVGSISSLFSQGVT